MLDFIQAARVPRGRIDLDVGTAEGAGTLRDVRRLGRLLVRKGFRRKRAPGRVAQAFRPANAGLRARATHELRYLEDTDARHHEAAWAGRLEGALAFLLE